MPLLPKISDRSEFAERYKESTLWEPAIRFIKGKHNLTGEFQRGTLGSHIVYRVGDHWIKLVAPVYSDELQYELSGLRAVENKLSFAVPKIVATGEHEKWKYVVLTHIQGDPIRTAWVHLSKEQKLDLIPQFAQAIYELGKCSPDETIQNRFQWNEFILSQFHQLEAQQRKKGLPDPWIESAKSFLNSFAKSEFECDHPILVHADLTFDHFLIQADSKKAKLSGIIDFADCQVGHPEYELIAPAIFLFKGQSEYLTTFLIEMGYSNENINHKLSEKLLAWSLLHRYFSCASYFSTEMNQVKTGDYVSLASKVFPLQ